MKFVCLILKQMYLIGIIWNFYLNIVWRNTSLTLELEFEDQLHPQDQNVQQFHLLQ